MTAESPRVEKIRRALLPLQPTKLVIVDDSHRHAGHAGARDGRGHYAVEVVSEEFRGLAPLARHRKVYEALGDLMQTDIHALTIKASAPG